MIDTFFDVLQRVKTRWRGIFLPHQRPFARAALGLVFATSLLIGARAWTSDGKLRVFFFDVGQGNSVLVQRGDFQMLVDGGPTGAVVQKLGAAMPFYDHTIEVMVLTHPHADHVTGLVEVLKRYQVKRVLSTGVLHTTDEYLAWLEAIKNQGLMLETPVQGEAIDLWKGESGMPDGKFEILWPKEKLSGERIKDVAESGKGGLNDTSLVGRLVYGDTRFMLTGDISEDIEKQLIASGQPLASDVLQVGHHGSKNSTSEAWLTAVHPQYAAIQVGKKNHYGHPAFKALWRLKQSGVTVFRNDEDGDVVFESDGRSLRYKGKGKR